MKTISIGLITGCLFLLTSCAGSVPEPTPAHERWAAKRWYGTRLNDLVAGRQLYVARCSGCHSLHPPGELSAQQWEKSVPEMKIRSKLTDEEARLILRYLVTLSENEQRQDAK